MTRRHLIARLTWLCAALDVAALSQLYEHAVRHWPHAATRETQL
jgi:hypothetical protein